MDNFDLIVKLQKLEPSLQVLAALIVYRAFSRNGDLEAQIRSAGFRNDFDYCLSRYPEFATVRPFIGNFHFSETIDMHKDSISLLVSSMTDHELFNMILEWNLRVKEFFGFEEQRLTPFVIRWLLQSKNNSGGDKLAKRAYCPSNNLISMELGLRNEGSMVSCPQIDQNQGLVKGLLYTLVEGNDKLLLSQRSKDKIGRGEQKYNIGFTLPPFVPYEIAPDRNRYELCVRDLLANVSGRSAIILPLSFACRGHLLLKKYREALVKQGVLQAVVRLPEGFCRGTNVSTTLLLLDNNRRSMTGDIVMVDLSRNDCKESISAYRYQTCLNQNAINQLEAALAGQPSEYAVKVSVETLSRNAWDLNPTRYVLDPETVAASEEIEKGTVQLSDIAKITRVQTIKSDDHGDLYYEVGAADIDKAGFVNKPEKEVLLSTSNRAKIYMLCNKDIIFAIKGSVGKVGFVEGTPSNWIANQSFVVIRVTAAGWSPEYVFRQLRSKAMQLYIARFATGAYIRSLPIGVLKTLPLAAPSAEQNSEAREKLSQQFEFMGQIQCLQRRVLSLDN